MQQTYTCSKCRVLAFTFESGRRTKLYLSSLFKGAFYVSAPFSLLSLLSLRTFASGNERKYFPSFQHIFRSTRALRREKFCCNFIFIIHFIYFKQRQGIVNWIFLRFFTSFSLLGSYFIERWNVGVEALTT